MNHVTLEMLWGLRVQTPLDTVSFQGLINLEQITCFLRLSYFTCKMGLRLGSTKLTGFWED
jgi:hypothetical protein